MNRNAKHQCYILMVIAFTRNLKDRICTSDNLLYHFPLFTNMSNFCFLALSSRNTHYSIFIRYNNRFLSDVNQLILAELSSYNINNSIYEKTKQNPCFYLTCKFIETGKAIVLVKRISFTSMNLVITIY